MKTPLPPPLIDAFHATRTRLRVLVLLALLLALVLPTSGYAVPAGAAARHAFAGGIGIAAHPVGLAAAIARDLGPAAPAAAPDPQLQMLTAADSAANAHFGIHVALSGDGNTALVGAPGKSVGSNVNAGAVYVYTNVGGTWTQQQVFTAADGVAKDGFGSTVALNGDGTIAVVGAFDKAITGHADAGAAYVFTRSGSQWTQQELSRSLVENNDFFGAGVVVSSNGTTILVGASGTMVGSNANAGAAYKYTRSGGTWTQQQVLTAADGAANDGFGISVALSSDGTTALIGAFGRHAGAGAAYVFNGSGITGIAAADATAGDSFGDAVALSGDGTIAVVGANGKSVGGRADAGAAYVLTFSGSTWTQQEVTADDGAAFDHFGAAVALSGDGTAALVGAFGKAVGSNTGAGAVYGYTPSGGSWVLQKASHDGAAAANEGFGISVALSGDGNAALVGAYGKTVGSNTGAGAVYVYLPSGASPSATPTPTVGAGAGATGTATAAPSAPAALTATPTGAASAAATATGTAAVTATATGIAAVTATPTGTTAAATPAASPGTGGPTAAYFAEGYTGTAATNGSATFAETLSILNPGTAPAPVTLTYYVQGASAPLTIGRTVPATSVLRESVNADVGADRVVAAQVASARRVYVTRTMARVAPDGGRLDGSATLPVGAPAATWGFPEGYTGVTFQEYLTILNPSASPAHVTVLLAPQAASAQGAKTLALTVPARSRATANIRALNQAGGAKSVGMLISSDQPIVPERVLYYGDGSGSGKFGSTVSSGFAGGAQRLFLAYGTSGGLAGSGGLNATGNQAFITLLNPSTGGAAVRVTATFADASGQQLGAPTVVSVAAGTRKTIIVNNVLGSRAVSVYSAVLTATGPIEAESAQYYGGSPNVGRHPGVAFPLQAAGGGAVALSDLETSLPDGTALQRTVYLYNPGTAAVQVAATYYGANGATAQGSYGVPAQGVTAVDVTQDAGLALPAGPLGAQFTAGGGGTVIAYAVGTTADGRSATEDVGAPAS